jgi:hypothetical protein
LVKDMELWVAKEQLDKGLPDLAAIKATYTHQVKLMDAVQLMSAATQGTPGVCLADVVITGEYKTKWCFRRVFNASHGRADVPARRGRPLSTRRWASSSEDFRILEQSR